MTDTNVKAALIAFGTVAYVCILGVLIFLSAGSDGAILLLPWGWLMLGFGFVIFHIARIGLS